MMSWSGMSLSDVDSLASDVLSAVQKTALWCTGDIFGRVPYRSSDAGPVVVHLRLK